MPKLSELTDYATPAETVPEKGVLARVTDKLFGLNGQERYQLWPEKMVRDAVTAIPTVSQPNPYPEGSEENYWFEDERQKAMIPAALNMAALAGTGGFAGTGKGGIALGSGPIKNFPLPDELFGTPPIPTIKNMKSLSKIENVDLSKVKSTNKLDWGKFDSGEHPGELIKGYGDKPVAVKKDNGEYLLLDGHHRSALARENGNTQIEMHVINAKDYAPEFAGKLKPPVKKWTEEDDELLKELGYSLKPVDRDPEF